MGTNVGMTLTVVLLTGRARAHYTAS